MFYLRILFCFLFFICVRINEHAEAQNIDCQRFLWLNQSDHEVQRAWQSHAPMQVRYFRHWTDSRLITGTLVLAAGSLNRGGNTVNVVQPLNSRVGCKQHIMATAAATAARTPNCRATINAGFFNTHSGQCYGNLIEEGKVYVNSGGIRNAHFGIYQNGSLYFGYPTREEVLGGGFRMMVGGAVWLLRSGNSAMSNSLRHECADIEESGSLAHFSEVESARSVVGSMRDGRVAVVHIGGRTNEAGLSLKMLTSLLLKLGFWHAVNLDGGGSSSLVLNHTRAYVPTDPCSDRPATLYSCPRAVSTVLCLSNPHSYSKSVFYSRGSVIILTVLTTLTIVTLLLLLVSTCRRWQRKKRLLDNSHSKGFSLTEFSHYYKEDDMSNDEFELFVKVSPIPQSA